MHAILACILVPCLSAVRHVPGGKCMFSLCCIHVHAGMLAPGARAPRALAFVQQHLVESGID
jgi:hypothetical protein